MLSLYCYICLQVYLCLSFKPMAWYIALTPFPLLEWAYTKQSLAGLIQQILLVVTTTQFVLGNIQRMSSTHLDVDYLGVLNGLESKNRSWDIRGLWLHRSQNIPRFFINQKNIYIIVLTCFRSAFLKVLPSQAVFNILFCTICSEKSSSENWLPNNEAQF